MTPDIKFMRRAVELAWRGLGRTSPNPLVGCVIVKKGRIIAEGWHKVYGGDHAEVDALKQAGARAEGGVMYVTLEPCAHQGQTPPCVDAVIASGIKRVVVAMQDPNPLTNGKSVHKLRRHGINVTVGVAEDEARRMNAPFIKDMTQHMPYVVAKTAQTMDGKAGTRSGRVQWITSEVTRRQAKALRSGFDAIMVGIGTVLADDPRLDAPGRQIVKVIVDGRLRMPLAAQALKAPGRVIIATTRMASSRKAALLRARGAHVIVCPDKGGRVVLKALFKALAKNGLIRILIEGGPTLISAALAEKLVDRMHIYIAPRVMGPVPDAVDGVDVASLLNSDRCDIVSVERIGRDLFIGCDLCKVEMPGCYRR